MKNNEPRNFLKDTDFEYIDFHTHMHDEAYDTDSDEVMQNIFNKNIICVTVGTDLKESRKAKELSDKYFNFRSKETSYDDIIMHSNIFYTIGVHPHDNLQATFEEKDTLEFESLLSDRCIAIGECGLDYFYLKSDKEKRIIENLDQEVDRQRDLFISQIKFATKHNLPLMIHGRCSEKDEIDNPNGMDAYEDILEILEKFYEKKSIKKELETQRNSAEIIKKEEINGNVHFFVGSMEIAQRFLDLNFTFSFGGVVTLTHDYDEVMKYIPIECMHAETDSPYVTPKDSAGKKVILNINSKINKTRNSSENIKIIIEKIAEIKNLEIEYVKNHLKQNFANFLRI